MPNWCTNDFFVAGDPEAVEEFRIVNAQHTERSINGGNLSFVSNKLEVASPREFEQDSIRLIAEREPNDLSFTSLLKGRAEDIWGVNWDVCGNCTHIRMDKGSWKLSAQGLSLDRLQRWNMDTPWRPPDRWMESIAPIFPDLKLIMGFSEPGMGKFGVLESSNHNHKKCPIDPCSDSQLALGLAVSIARKDMPLHRKPGPLLRSIWNDNVAAVGACLKRLHVQNLQAQTGSRWTPLMHAAFAGSQKVASLLLKAGADPLACVNLGQGRKFSLADICMDGDYLQTEELLDARQKIFLEAISFEPRLGSQALASGRYPLTMAVRFQMGQIIEPLIASSQLTPESTSQLTSQCGNTGMDNNLIDTMASHYSPGLVLALVNSIAPSRRSQFACEIAPAILRAQSNEKKSETRTCSARAAKLFMRLHDEGLAGDGDFRIACGEAPVQLIAHALDNSGGLQSVASDSSFFVNTNFCAAIASERARRAIDKALSESCAKISCSH